MTHSMELLPWLRRARSLFGRVAVLALVPIFMGEVTYSSLANIATFAIVERVVGQWLPWVEMICLVALLASIGALLSTWWARDWWVERWARSHENFAG